MSMSAQVIPITHMLLKSICLWGATNQKKVVLKEEDLEELVSDSGSAEGLYQDPVWAKGVRIMQSYSSGVQQ